METADRFQAAISRFDEANAQDPSGEALVYARRMSDRLDRFAPDAPEALKLAARAQHIQRWTIPRNTYPMTRAGYHQWRDRLAQFHAETAGAIMRDVGYDEQAIARVQSLLRKENLKTDPLTQTLEDVICLVFLESYFADFAHKHETEEDKLVTILRRTWGKMSPRGREEAMKLPLGPRERELIDRALNRGAPGAS